MDRRTILAILLSVAIIMGWNKFYVEPRMPKRQVAPQSNSSAQATGTTASSTNQPVAASPSVLPQRPAETRNLSTGTGDAKISNGPQLLVGWDLKSYRLGLTPETAAVDLNWVTHRSSAVEILFDDKSPYNYVNKVQGALSEIPSGYRWTYEDENIKLIRDVIGKVDQNWLDLTVTAEFKKGPASFAYLALSSQAPAGKDDEAQDRQLIYYTKNSVERLSVDGIKQLGIGTSVKYVGATSRYFLLALVNNGPLEPKGLIQALDQRAGRASLVYPVSGNSLTIPAKVYFGPKELDTLRSVDPALNHAVNFGWFTFVAYPILRLLKWLHDFTANWGVAIILLTILIKIALYPLAYKSVKSMKEMAKIQPQLVKIREKHKDDKEALNREMLSLMRTHGYNPMAGCWPILLQMPVFFALYQVLWGSIELYHAPFALWIRDLSAFDPWYVTPVILTLTMWIQQKITPVTATDPAQVKMMQIMPVIFGAFMLWLPSGLTLYMLVNAVTSIIQQLILNKKFNIQPNVPALPANAR